MKIAIFSDIHGNIYSLMKVLEDIDSERVDKIICLGDLVGYGPHPNEVIALIKRRDIDCIKGNYDASVVDSQFSFIRNTKINSFSLPWTCDEIRNSNKYFLSTLPESIELKVNNVSLLFTHGSPSSINEYLFEGEKNTLKALENLNHDVLVCAHTHIPCLMEHSNKKLINPGSVGKPKNNTPNATYAIININDNNDVTVSFKTIEYEFKRIIKDCIMLNFPSDLYESYKTGKE